VQVAVVDEAEGVRVAAVLPGIVLVFQPLGNHQKIKSVVLAGTIFDAGHIQTRGQPCVGGTKIVQPGIAASRVARLRDLRLGSRTDFGKVGDWRYGDGCCSVGVPLRPGDGKKKITSTVTAISAINPPPMKITWVSSLTPANLLSIRAVRAGFSCS